MPNPMAQVDKLKGKELQDLLWKAKQAVAEGYNSPFQKVTLTWDPNLPGYRLGLPYKKEFVTLFKAAVPDHSRNYDLTSQTWAILEPYYVSTLRNILLHYANNDIAKLQSRNEFEALLAANQNAAPEASKEESAAVHFVAHLNPESLAAAFKKRATTLHPDAGGDASDFADFNAAYQILKGLLK